jgi:hypothetical protein
MEQHRLTRIVGEVAEALELHHLSGGGVRAMANRVTLPRWAIYASMVSYAAVAAIGFGLGWVVATGRWWP